MSRKITIAKLIRARARVLAAAASSDPKMVAVITKDSHIRLRKEFELLVDAEKSTIKKIANIEGVDIVISNEPLVIGVDKIFDYIKATTDAAELVTRIDSAEDDVIVIPRNQTQP